VLLRVQKGQGSEITNSLHITLLFFQERTVGFLQKLLLL
jgi:hypothetical protein